jgi:hypothetical protein
MLRILLFSLKLPMLYQERLKKWAVVRLTSDSKPVILERFRSVADAEGHLQVLRKQMPRERFMVIFDRPPVENPDATTFDEMPSEPGGVSAN